MNETTLYIAIISGLVGSTVTALLAYVVHISIENWKIKQEEKRTAYNYLIKVSQLLALKTIIIHIVKAYSPLYENELKEFNEENFEIPHAVCVYMAESIKETDEEALEKISSLSIVKHFFEVLIESLSDYDLPISFANKIPKETALHYSLFLNYVTSVKNSLNFICKMLDSNSLKHIDAEFIYTQWELIKKLIEYAETVRLYLIKFGGFKYSDAEFILKKQIKQLHETGLVSFLNKDKLKAATESYLKQKDI